MQEKLTLEIKPSEDFKNYIQELSRDIKELIKVMERNNVSNSFTGLDRGFGPFNIDIEKE